ncbi:MAG: hypothetical protein WCG51_05270 [Elusimicrobiota bacterium]
MGKKLFPRVIIAVCAVLMCVVTPCMLHADADIEGSKEDAVFQRAPGYHIIEYENNDDAIDYNYTAEKRAIIAGQRTYFNYSINENAPVSDPAEIIQYYTAIVRRQGGETIFSGPTKAGFYTATFKIIRKDRETWVLLTPFNNGAGYFLNMVEHAPQK